MNLTEKHLDFVNFESRLKDIGGGRSESLATIAAERHRMLNELLCIIHRDGGHRLSDVGYTQAFNEAISIVSKAVQHG